MAKRAGSSRRSRPAAPSRKKVVARKKAQPAGKTRSRPGSAGRKKPAARKTKAPAPKKAKKPAASRPAAPAGRATVGTLPRRARPFDEPEETFVETPTSFHLDLRQWRTAEALEETFDPDPNSAAALAAGDREVGLEGAATVGDETPGGDNPTPDQDVVDLIGRALGVEYADDEELEGGEEITERDRHRWELDPLSSEDFRDRQGVGPLKKAPGPFSGRPKGRP